MYELFTIIVRYALVALATYLTSVGYFDDTLIDPLASLGVVILTGLWVLWDRYWYPKKRKTKYVDPNKEFNGGYDSGGW